MLIYFHENKCNYEKGQLAPFFIVIMVILVILALVTVNISKVGFIRTESANAVDAGALAAGSVMSNLFNAIGQANRIAEAAYCDFFDKASVYFIAAAQYLVTAYIYANEPVLESPDSMRYAELALEWACVSPCYAAILAGFAISSLTSAIFNVIVFIDIVQNGIKPTVTDYKERQFKYYQDIRKAAEEARCKAIKLGHKLAFMNSGIGDKDKNRDTFTSFLGNIQCKETQEYKWTDGQGREHAVEIKVKIKKVDKFELKVSRNTYSEEIEALDEIIDKATRARGLMESARSYYQTAQYLLWIACFNPLLFWLCAIAAIYLSIGIQLNIQAVNLLKELFTDLPVAWNKLLPSEETFMSISDGDADDQIIDWIEEIDHDRLVRVESKQKHDAREETGIWNARYPEIKTYSVVNFNFKDTGQIHRPRGPNIIEGPVLRHLPSIIETDKIGNSGS